MRVLISVLLALALGGCVRTAASIVTFPVKAASQGVDWATTSRDEADRNRGRQVRRQEERDAKQRRREERQQRHRAEQDQPY